MNNNNLRNTQYFKAPSETALEVDQILERVYRALV